MKYGFLCLIAIWTTFTVLAADKAAERKGKPAAINIMSLPIAEIEAGQHLSHAQAYSLPQFVGYYLKTGASGQSKKYGMEHTRIIYTDDQFTYFVRQVENAYIIHFFKVLTAGLKQVDLDGLDGKQIRKQFIDEVVSEADKLHVKKKNHGFIHHFDSNFTYHFLPDKKQVEIIYHWKLTDDLGFKIINKQYRAVYDLESKQFSDIRISSAKKK
ncbi:hypothetical protein [Edaphocola aurantiacus]|uniref:hypothetical protein n=1 Tax=Edaphocola aurantiacus TaxID=2601682 RepID=UPI001C94BD8E|nr:hypothetical protein [Edaphocola aurantiacus]